MKFSYATEESSELRSAAEAARRAGFDGLTVPARALNFRDLSQTGRREVRALLSRHELAGAALRVTLPGKGLTANADADRILDGLRRAIIGARDCGFAMVACDLGALPRATVAPAKPKPIDPAAAGAILLPTPTEMQAIAAPPPPPLTDAEKQHAAFAADVLRELARGVDTVGLPVAFSATLASTIDLTAVLERVGYALFFRELDPASTVEELSADVDAIVKTNPPLLHVRATDAQTGSGGRVRSADVGAGDVPWADLVESLKDADFAGFITCAGPIADASRARAHLMGE